MESTARKATILWQSILSGDLSYSVHDSPHPHVSHSVHAKVHIWATRLSESIIYPHFGHKLLSVGSQRNIRPVWQDQDREMSSWQAEYHYMLTGEEGESPCEMKQAWKPAQLVPRTYYAQGLSAFHSSKYLRDPFNRLADYFRNVNRFNRVLPQMIVADTTDTLYVYDLTSFTSMFHEHRSFLLSLADEVEGYHMTLYDSHYGISHATLSFLIRDYVDKNVSNPEYTTLLFPLEQTLVLQHNVAGFLGVYGNLVTCTIPHGIVLASVYDTWINNWCAGDDAGEAIPEELFPRLDKTITRVGSYAWDKVCIGNLPGAVALKRPVSFEHGLVIFKSTPLFPLLGYIIGSDHLAGPPKTKSELQSMLASSMVNFLRYNPDSDLPEFYVDEIVAYSRLLYNCLGLPTDGFLPHVMRTLHWDFSIPIVDRRMFQNDPLLRLADKYYATSYCSAVREEREVDMDVLYRAGASYGNMTPWLRWAGSMGFVKSEKMMVQYVGREGYLKLLVDLNVPSCRSYAPISYYHVLINSVPTRHLAAPVL